MKAKKLKRIAHELKSELLKELSLELNADRRIIRSDIKDIRTESPEEQHAQKSVRKIGALLGLGDRAVCSEVVRRAEVVVAENEILKNQVARLELEAETSGETAILSEELKQ